MSANISNQQARRARQESVILSGYRIVRSAEPSASEFEQWVSFFDGGGTPEGFLARLRGSPDADLPAAERHADAARSTATAPRVMRDVQRRSGGFDTSTGSGGGRGSAVILSTYPPDPPEHGGQHRVRNIGAAYRAAGFDVRHAGVLGGSGYGQSSGFLPFPGSARLSAIDPSPMFMEDWSIGELYAGNEQYEQALRSHLGSPPDVIHVEQPWLFGFAKRWASSAGGRRSRLVYGSQNVEHLLKFGIVEKYFGRKAALDARQKVLDCELEAIRAADEVVAVSAEDCRWIEQQGNRRAILAANGVHERHTTDEGITEANAISGNAKFALVSGSAHPPNISSIYEIFGNGMACFSPREKMVIAGGLGPALQADPGYRSNAGLQRYVLSPGIVGEACLAGLLQTAHAILLPITSGEGSNLKTAEALWAGKHIVATSRAFRGYEAFLAAPGVTIADDPAAFLHAVRRVMTSGPFEIPADERNHRRQLLWTHTLRPLTECVASLQLSSAQP